MWRQGEVPQDFEEATTGHLHKRKGNSQVCDNHRGICLLNVVGNVFARILLNRLNNHLEQGLLPESQCGFRRHRWTTDMIFDARKLQEKCQEMRTHLYSTLVDLTKSFDTGALKASLKRLQINPTNGEELARDRPTWRRTVKTDVAVYETNRIAAAKAKREASKSQLRPVRNADAQPLPTCPRSPTAVPPPASSSSSLPPTTSGLSSEPPLPSSSSSSSTTTTTTSISYLTTVPTTAAQAGVSHITNPDTTTDTTPTSSDSSDEDQNYICPRCDRIFTSHIGLVGHLRIHRTNTAEAVSGAATYTHRTPLHCPH
nr:unnamed protein product [Spirometra erinaceieuropaei]